MTDSRPTKAEASKRQDALLALFRDKKIHGALELREIAGHNYTARLYELRGRGCVIRTIPGATPDGFSVYQLISEDGPVKTEANASVNFTLAELESLQTISESAAAKIAVGLVRAKAKQKLLDANQPDEPNFLDFLKENQ